MNYVLFTKSIISKIRVLLLFLFLAASFSSFGQTSVSVNVGDDFSACENDIYVSGNAQNYETVLWNTDGDGFFENPENLSTAYFPGAADVLAGQVELCLTAYANGSEATDCVLVTIGLLPSIEIGVESDIICYDEAYSFQNVTASNYSSVQWLTVNGSGVFSNENGLNTMYFPNSVSDYIQGCIEIIVYALGQSPCNVFVEDGMELCFQPSPVFDVGGEMHYACYDEDYTFESATAENYSYLQWINLTGGGYFLNENAINATYVPDPELDYPQGCITVMLYGEPIAPCAGAIEEYVLICFQAPPEVDAGVDETIISGNAFVPSPFVANQSSVMWETSGDGTFDDPSMISPQYFSGIQDQQNGSVMLTLNVFSEANCPGDYSDQMSLSIITEQSLNLNAGLNGISFYVDVDDLDIATLTAPIADELIYAKDGLQVYFPQYGINTFGDATGFKALILKLETPSVLNLLGTKTAETIVNLPVGWSLLSVPTSCSVDYQDVISNLGENLVIVAEIDGQGVIYPEGGIFTLTALMPGKSYLIKMSAPEQMIFEACN